MAWTLRRQLLAAAAVGVLLTAVLVSVAPETSGAAAAAIIRFVVRFWPGLLLATVAALFAMTATAERRREAPRRQGPPPLPLLVHVALLLGLAAAVALGVGTLLWTAVGRPSLAGAPTPTVSTPGSPFPAPDGWTLTNTFDAMKIVLAVVGGIGGVVALTVAYRRQHLGEAAEHREEAKEHRENTKLFNERFAKAVELLGSDKAAVRLAGVYAIGALADDWRGGRQMCIDVLCAYLRMPYTPPAVLQPTGEPTATSAEGATATPIAVDTPGRDPHEERQVRHTVIRLVRDHLCLQANHPHSWGGRDLDFTGAVFDGGDFGGATFAGGTVSFSGAVFASGPVHFRDATFSRGTVDFTGATFRGGTLDFDGATFSGGTVTFARATFTGGTVTFDRSEFSGGRLSFARATFTGGTVSFGRSEFSGSIMSFAGATFTGGTVSFRGVEVSRSRVDFKGATFSGGTVSFSAAEFSGGWVDFEDAAFSGGTVDFSTRISGGTVVAWQPDRVVTFSGGTLSTTGTVTIETFSALFTGGTVDLSKPRTWAVPPTFDAGFAEPPPPGLLLPPSGITAVAEPGADA